jgi:hypothetical protein
MKIVLRSRHALSSHCNMMIFVSFVVIVMLMFGRHMGRKRDGWYETRAVLKILRVLRGMFIGTLRYLAWVGK